MKRLLAMKRLVVLLSALSLVACLDVSGPGPSDPANETFATSLGVGNLKDTAVWKQTANGTYYREEVLGTGAALFLPDFNDSIYVDYTGWLKDGTNFAPAQANAPLPAAQIITGFLDGMVGMRIGGTRLVVVPSNLAYGNSTRGGIPANATLVFRIKLNSFTGAP
jgi:FKBP-type peptidyl-prolyl cis-trans isomerase FkpA